MHHHPCSLPMFIQSVGFVRGCPIRVMPTALPVPVSVPAAITTATSSFVPRTRSATWPRPRSVSSGIFARSISVAITILVAGSGPSVRAYWGRSGATSTTLTSLLEWRAVPRGSTAPVMIDAWRGRTSRTDSALVVVMCRAVTCAIHRRRRWSRWRFGIRPGAAFVPLWVHHDAGPKDWRTPIRIETAFHELHSSFQIFAPSSDLDFLSVHSRKRERNRERQTDLERESII